MALNTENTDFTTTKRLFSSFADNFKSIKNVTTITVEILDMALVFLE